MADLQFTVSALDKATAALLKVAAQLDKVGDKIDKLDGKVARIAVALEGDKKAEAGLDSIERKVTSLDGKKATVKVDVDKSLGDSLIKVSLLGRALKAIALPATAVAVAPQIAELGAAAMSAVGAIGLLPAAVGAAGLAAGTASISFGNLLTYFTASSDKKKKEAYDALSASGQHLADVIKGMTPRFQALRAEVQNAVFEGLANQVKPLVDTYLPALQSQMVRVGRVFNTTALSLSGFFRQKDVASDLTSSLNSMRLAVQNVVLAARPLAQVLVDVITTGAARLPGLTAGIAGAAAKFAGFVRAARDSGQLGAWIDKGVQTVKLLGETVLHVGSILMSVFRAATAEGADLIRTLADVTGKVAEVLKSAQGQNTLAAVFDTIRAAVTAVRPVVEALVPLLGIALVSAGKTLVTVFQALGPPLRDVANALTNSLGPVLPKIAQSFGQIFLALIPIIAPITALIPAFDAIARVIAVAAEVAAKFFTAFAGTGAALFRALIPLITGVADVLTLLLRVIEPIAPALGVVAAAFLAFKTASAGLSAVQDVFKGVGIAIQWAGLRAGEFATAVTGSEAAAGKLMAVTGKLSTALGMVGVALPVIAVAAAAVAFTYDQMRDKSDELAASVVAGQLSMSAAVAEQSARLQEQSIVTQEVSGETEAMGQGIGELTGQLQENSNQIDTTTQAYDQMTAAAEAHLQTLPPLEQATQRVRFEEERYATAVQLFGQNSPQARAAQDDLTAARQHAKDVTQQTADAEKTLGDAIAETSNKASAAANADVAYQQGLLSLAEASDRAAEAARSHAAGSDEVTRANLAVQQASLSAADAARRKAQADAEARGASDAAAIGAQAYKDELQRQADTLEGPAKRAALDNIKLLGGQQGASDAARTASNLYKGELQSLADKENGPLKAAITGTLRDFDNLGGAHATAEQKSAAQRAALQRLADQAQGPTKQAILDMIRTIDQIHDKSFTVKGTGQVSYGSIGGPDLVRMAHGGHTGGVIGMNRAGQVTGVGYADGGVLPGYTPGRDVHTFAAANGSILNLSGGEAVMRPEWTRAVGPEYVKGANAAARQGGVAGVAQFMTNTAPRRSGEGQQGDGNSFANGGIIGGNFADGGRIVLDGTQPFKVIPPNLEIAAFQELVDKMAPVMAQKIRDAEAALSAAAGGVAGIAGGGAQAALAWARTQVGKPYVWGATGPRGYDCCVPDYTLVSGPDGPRRIDELKVGDRVWSFVDGRMEPHAVAAQWFSKRQMVYRVRTRNRAVDASANHPFLVMRQQAAEQWLERREAAEWVDADVRQPYGGKGKLPCRISTCAETMRVRGLCFKHNKRLVTTGDPLLYHVHQDTHWDLEWVRLDVLRRGDLLVTEASEPNARTGGAFPDGTPITEDLAWLIGAVTGDGHLTLDGIHLAVHGDVRARAVQIFKDWTGKTCIYGNASTIIVNSRRHRQLLEDMGLRVLAPKKRVPVYVWSWPVALQKSFLEGFCDTDGHRPVGNRHGDRVYRSASRQLLAEVRLLHIAHGDRVSNLGIADHRRKEIVIAGVPVINAKPLWSFTVYPADQEYARVRTARRTEIREAQDSWGGRFKVQPILAIDALEEMDTYDIEVEGAHNFVADGVVVHNSGFQSAITNVMRGRNPYSRVGATGSFPWAGFAPGLGGQYAIGAFRGNPGHMAGTLAPGINVESSGGVGVRVGGGARGANNGMFNIRGHLGDTGGMLRHGEAAVNMSGGLERLLPPDQTRVLDQILAAVAGGRSSGAGSSELIAAVQALSGQLKALRGDVDHHSDNATIAGEIRGLRYQLASTESAAVSSQTARTRAELGAWG